VRAIDYEVVVPQEFYTFLRDQARVLLGRVEGGAGADLKESYDRILEAIEGAGQTSYTFAVLFGDMHFFLAFLRHLLRRSKLPRGFHTWLMTMYEGAEAHRRTNVVDFIGEIE